MKRWGDIVLVLCLLFILIFWVITGWGNGSGTEEKNGRNPDTNEQWIESRLDHWIPKMP